MKNLYLIRHAKSSWDFSELDDFDRPLNRRGEKSAPLIGKRLMTEKIIPDMIVSSPANRAITTAKVIAQKVGFPVEQIITNDAIYHGGVSTFIGIIRTINNSFERVFLFGHNPGLTMLANSLSDFREYNVPTCGVVGIAFNVTSWTEIDRKSGKNIYYDYPKKYL